MAGILPSNSGSEDLGSDLDSSEWVSHIQIVWKRVHLDHLQKYKTLHYLGDLTIRVKQIIEELNFCSVAKSPINYIHLNNRVAYDVIKMAYNAPKPHFVQWIGRHVRTKCRITLTYYGETTAKYTFLGSNGLVRYFFSPFTSSIHYMTARHMWLAFPVKRIFDYLFIADNE